MSECFLSSSREVKENFFVSGGVSALRISAENLDGCIIFYQYLVLAVSSFALFNCYCCRHCIGRAGTTVTFDLIITVIIVLIVGVGSLLKYHLPLPYFSCFIYCYVFAILAAVKVWRLRSRKHKFHLTSFCAVFVITGISDQESMALNRRTFENSSNVCFFISLLVFGLLFW